MGVRNEKNIGDWENDKDRRSGGKKKGDFIGERTIKFRRSRREGLFGEKNRKWGRKIEEGRREERTERERIKTLTGHSCAILSVVFSADGEYLASGSWDKTIGVWRVSSGERIKTLTGHSN